MANRLYEFMENESFTSQNVKSKLIGLKLIDTWKLDTVKYIINLEGSFIIVATNKNDSIGEPVELSEALERFEVYE